MPVTISCPGLQGCKKCLPEVFMINPLEVLSYSQVSGTCQQSMFKACTKCCYATLAEILNEMAFPNLCLCRGSPALSPRLLSQLVLDAASPHKWVTVPMGITPVPASPLALLLCLVLEGAAQSRPKDRHSCSLTAGGRTGTGQGTAAMEALDSTQF